ncbi:MAG TPA: hypothetical protein VFV50_11910 [Bdellovibrionales bacterium]|nr:hypothetical protein [Bdellovibrionales bacterium]
MKFAGLAAFLFALNANAVTAPLVTKSSTTGFTPPEWSRVEVCEVYSDKVVITKRYGGEKGFTLVDTRPIRLSAGIQSSLKLAAAEKIEQKDNGLCDGPSTVIFLGQRESAQILFATGGCGSPRQNRAGPHSDALRGLVSTYCPLTYDLGR